MATDNGEHVLDDLMTLGYAIELDDDGSITATKDGQTLHGKAQHGAIEWRDRSLVYHITERAYIERLRQRIDGGPGERART
jgi:hypothetical protein